MPSTELKSLDIYTRNSLANPFFKAYSHAEWVKIVKAPDFQPFGHTIVNNEGILLKYRKYNNHLGEFLKIWDNLNPDVKRRVIKYTKDFIK